MNRKLQSQKRKRTLAARRAKNGNGKGKPNGNGFALLDAVQLSEQPTLSGISEKITALNERDGEIQTRLGVINAESARLHSELHGNEVRRLQFLRQHDQVAQGLA